MIVQCGGITGERGVLGQLASVGSLVRSGKRACVSGRALWCSVVALTVYTGMLVATLYIAALAMVPIPAGLLCYR